MPKTNASNTLDPLNWNLYIDFTHLRPKLTKFDLSAFIWFPHTLSKASTLKPHIHVDAPPQSSNCRLAFCNSGSPLSNSGRESTRQASAGGYALLTHDGTEPPQQHACVVNILLLLCACKRISQFHVFGWTAKEETIHHSTWVFFQHGEGAWVPCSILQSEQTFSNSPRERVASAFATPQVLLVLEHILFGLPLAVGKQGIGHPGWQALARLSTLPRRRPVRRKVLTRIDTLRLTSGGHPSLEATLYFCRQQPAVKPAGLFIWWCGWYYILLFLGHGMPLPWRFAKNGSWFRPCCGTPFASGSGNELRPSKKWIWHFTRSCHNIAWVACLFAHTNFVMAVCRNLGLFQLLVGVLLVVATTIFWVTLPCQNVRLPPGRRAYILGHSRLVPGPLCSLARRAPGPWACWVNTDFEQTRTFSFGPV